MPSKVYSAALNGINAEIIEVETDLTTGLHAFNIVGLPDSAVKEARDRVSAALRNSQCFPPQRYNKKITINLAPADLKKEGPGFDLAIALGFLLSSNQLKPKNLEKKMFLGELALDGAIRKINGAIVYAQAAASKGFKEIIVPLRNLEEAGFTKNISAKGAAHLNEVIEYLEGKRELPETTLQKSANAGNEIAFDISEIKGQASAKRLLEIAAAGSHNILFSGPPGIGKTLLAKSLVTLLPPPNEQEVLEMTKIWSVAGLLKENTLATSRPFRAPHHSASEAAIIGGGTNAKPGEITLAHRGVLLLDELAEFPRNVLEVLRQPLEEGWINIARAKRTIQYPARFLLVGATNPCPCGNLNHPRIECRCTSQEILRYQKKISGPILDRIDLHMELTMPETDKLLSRESDGEKSADIQSRVALAREKQFARAGKLNNELSLKEIKAHCALETAGETIVRKALDSSLLSARSLHKVLKISRTIADLDNAKNIQSKHLTEALQYRPKTNN